MKTLGLLGGMSWESTIPYYRIINERVREEVMESLSLLALRPLGRAALESALTNDPDLAAELGIAEGREQSPSRGFLVR